MPMSSQSDGVDGDVAEGRLRVVQYSQCESSRVILLSTRQPQVVISQCVVLPEIDFAFAGSHRK